MLTLLRAVRSALRSLRSRPAFTALNAAVLALGIGGVTTIAGLVGALMRPLPYPGPDRIVFVTADDERGNGALTAAEVEALRAGGSLERVAAIGDDLALVGTGVDAHGHRGIRTAELAELVGARARLGRSLAAADDGSVLLSEWFWKHELGGRTDVVGRSVVIDHRAVTVAGVLDHRVPLKPLLGFEPAWLRPFDRRPEAATAASVVALARLRPGVSLASAQAELDLLSRRLAPGGGPSRRLLRLMPAAATVDPVARVLIALALAAILGIVCLDVGGVLVASALVRAREMAIRQAIGGSGRDVSALLLAEGVLLGLLGGVLAIPLVVAGGRALAAFTTGTNAEMLAIEPDRWLSLTALGASVLAGSLAGLAPALQWRGQEPARVLNEAAQSATASRRAGRLRFALVSAQVAVSLALLTQAGLALASLRALLAVDRGFDARGVLALPLIAAGERPLGRELLERVAAAPGVTAAVLASALPAEAPVEPYRVVGGAAGQARLAAVSAGYFRALGMALRGGRLPGEADGQGAPAVAVVNDVLAGDGGSARALGAVIEVGGARRTVIGVVGATRNAPLQLRPRPEIYVPWEQSAGRSGWLLAATPFDSPLQVATAVAAAVDGDRDARRSGGLRALDDALATNMGAIRLGTALVVAVALAGLVLTMAGSFGVVSFLVARRTREIGIRMALGAARRSVLRLVLVQGLRPVAIGAALGTAASLALGRVLASRVHGLQPVEPLLLAAGVLLLLAALAVACALPAWRATRVDPVTALRCE